jgi:hypothetical protein
MADDLITADEACMLLEVDADRFQAMVDEEMLSGVESDDGPRYSRAEVLALRELGG